MTIKKWLVPAVVSGLLLILTADYLGPLFLFRKLEDVDKRAHQISSKLVGNHIVGNKNIKFFVNYNPLWWLVNGIDGGAKRINKDVIHIGPRALMRDDLDILLAHEIGHSERGSSQHEANLFALRILGNQQRGRFINSRKRIGYSVEDIDKVLQEFDTKHNGQTEKIGFGISIIPLGLSSPNFLRICKDLETKHYKNNYLPIEFVTDSELKEMASSKWENNKPIVSFHPFILAWDETLLTVLAAHEIGHIFLNTADQISADAFAAKAVGGKETVKKVLLDLGLASDHPRIIALSN